MLGEIGDLLEIRGDNPFKIRAYRNAAETSSPSHARVADMPDAALRGLPGIGKDIAHAHSRDRRDGRHAVPSGARSRSFPPTLLDVLRLQGVGPEDGSAALQRAGCRLGRQLEAACKDGRVRALKGMGAKKEALILKAIEERKRTRDGTWRPGRQQARARSSRT